MDYEIIKLEEKTVVGISARTNNASPDMTSVIGGLWGRFYQEGFYTAITGKVNEKALGIYTDYADDEKGDYTILVACETTEEENMKNGAVVRKIPAGSYARFIVKGDLHKAVTEFWEKLQAMNLPRAFVCDFEEYQNSDMDQAEIHMYIGLKEQ